MNWIERVIIRGISMTVLGKIFQGKLGWKTVVSSIVLALLILAEHYAWLTPDKLVLIKSVAVGTFGIGLRDALSKLKG